MSETNKRNLVYFENPSMRGLYVCMDEWQQANNRRLLSISVQQDSGNYCCIALTNPTEVVITDSDGQRYVGINRDHNALDVFTVNLAAWTCAAVGVNVHSWP